MYCLQDSLLHSKYKFQLFIKFSYMGDHVLGTKLRSERCTNDFNHFQLVLLKYLLTVRPNAYAMVNINMINSVMKGHIQNSGINTYTWNFGMYDTSLERYDFTLMMLEHIRLRKIMLTILLV